MEQCSGLEIARMGGTNCEIITSMTRRLANGRMKDGCEHLGRIYDNY